MSPVKMLTLLFPVLWLCAEPGPGSEAVANRCTVYRNSSSPRFQRGRDHMTSLFRTAWTFYAFIMMTRSGRIRPSLMSSTWCLQPCFQRVQGWKCDRPHSPNGTLSSLKNSNASCPLT